MGNWCSRSPRAAQRKVVVPGEFRFEPSDPCAVAPGPLGVGAAFLRRFLDQNPNALEMTTSEVAQEIVLKHTAQLGSPYTSLLSPPEVGPATVFISHAWTYPFRVPLDVMLEHAEADPGAFFWFDVFVNNQHDTNELPQEFWTSTFQSSIERIGRVILVSHPWSDPLPLTRAWCLYEIMCSLQSPAVTFSVRLPRSEQHAFRDALIDDPNSAVDALVRTQAEKSEAFDPKDKAMIFQVIHDGIGFDRLNELVKDQMRGWFLATGLAVAGAMETEDGVDMVEMAKLCHNLGDMLRKFSKYDEALGSYKKALRIRLGALGENHLDTAMTYSCMGNVYVRFSNYERAVECFTKSLSARLATVGEMHSETAKAYNGLARVHEMQGEHGEALRLWTKVLEIRSSVLGERTAKTAETVCFMAGAHASKGDYEQALKLYQDSLDVLLEVVGSDDPHTAKALFGMGEVLYLQGKHAEAAEHHERAYRIRVTTLGTTNEMTADSCHQLGLVYQAQGDASRAHMMLIDAAGTYRVLLGENHNKTIEAQAAAVAVEGATEIAHPGLLMDAGPYGK